MKFTTTAPMLTTTAPIGLRVGDSIVCANGAADIMRVLTSTTYEIKWWPWWKYLWMPLHRFLVRCRVLLEGMSA